MSRIKYLGIDWGRKRIGLALADSETKMAWPFKTVASLSEIMVVVKEEKINRIILGQPLKMADSNLKPDAIFTQFADLLTNQIQLLPQPRPSVILIDERLTSRQADGLEGDKKNKASRDEIAAMLILQAYLDKN